MPKPQGDASGGRFATPAAATGITVCRRLRIPLEFLPTVTGILSYLTRPRVWDDGAEGISAEDAAQAMAVMLDQYFTEKCGVIGEIQMFALTTLPSGWLRCDGGTYNRVDYPELYAVLHSNLIVDADHFKTPDFIGQYPTDHGQGAVALYDAFIKFGDNSGIIDQEHLPPHTHTVGPHNHQLPLRIAGDLDLEGPGAPQPNAAQIIPFIADYTAYSAPFETGDGGFDHNPFSILPRTLAVLFGIRARL
jgi:hypothetical protein